MSSVSKFDLLDFFDFYTATKAVNQDTMFNPTTHLVDTIYKRDNQYVGFSESIPLKKEFADVQAQKEDKVGQGATFDFLPHQKFVARFLSPYTPYTKLLAIHGVGTGKTLLYVAATELARSINPNLKPTLVLVSRANLIKDAIYKILQNTGNTYKYQWTEEDQAKLEQESTEWKNLSPAQVNQQLEIRKADRIFRRQKEKLSKAYDIVSYYEFALRLQANGQPLCVSCRSEDEQDEDKSEGDQAAAKRTKVVNQNMEEVDEKTNEAEAVNEALATSGLNPEISELYQIFGEQHQGPVELNEQQKNAAIVRINAYAQQYANRIIAIDEVHNLKPNLDYGKDEDTVAKVAKKARNKEAKEAESVESSKDAKQKRKRDDKKTTAVDDDAFQSASKRKLKGDTYARIKKFLQDVEGCRVMLLTGTPMRNDPKEIVNILNLLRSPYNQVTTKQIKALFIPTSDTTITLDISSPAARKFWYSLQGVISYVRPMQLVQTIEMGPIINPPLKKQRVYPLEMCAFQTRVYKAALKKDQQSGDDPKDQELGWENSILASIAVFPDCSWRLSSDKKSSKQEALKRLIDVILAKKSMQERLEELRKYSVKFWFIVKTILANRNQKMFIYTGRHVEINGAIVLSRIFEAFGITKYSKTGASVTNPQYIILTSSTATAEQTNMLLNDVFNNPSNRYGEMCQVAIGSHVVGEGVDLKHVRKTFVLSPFWNHATLEQAIGRTVRTNSHEGLRPEERNVEVYYLVAIPQVTEQRSKQADKFNLNKYVTEDNQCKIQALREDDTICQTVESFQQSLAIELKPPLRKTSLQVYNSVDLYAYTVQEDKSFRIKAFERVLKEIAVDCPLHRHRNILPFIFDNTRECDYKDCNYECKEFDKDMQMIAMPRQFFSDYEGIDKVTPTINDTYHLHFADTDIQVIQEEVANLFLIKSSYLLDELYQKLKSLLLMRNVTTLNNIVLARALYEMISNNVILYNKLGFPNFLRVDKDMYFLSDDSISQSDYTSAVYAANPSAVYNTQDMNELTTLVVNKAYISYVQQTLQIALQQVILSAEPDQSEFELLKQMRKVFDNALDKEVVNILLQQAFVYSKATPYQQQLLNLNDSLIDVFTLLLSPRANNSFVNLFVESSSVLEGQPQVMFLYKSKYTKIGKILLNDSMQETLNNGSLDADWIADPDLDLGEQEETVAPVSIGYKGIIVDGKFKIITLKQAKRVQSTTKGPRPSVHLWNYDKKTQAGGTACKSFLLNDLRAIITKIWYNSAVAQDITPFLYENDEDKSLLTAKEGLEIVSSLRFNHSRNDKKNIDEIVKTLTEMAQKDRVRAWLVTQTPENIIRIANGVFNIKDAKYGFINFYFDNEALANDVTKMDQAHPLHQVNIDKTYWFGSKAKPNEGLVGLLISNNIDPYQYFAKQELIDYMVTQYEDNFASFSNYIPQEVTNVSGWPLLDRMLGVDENVSSVNGMLSYLTDVFDAQPTSYLQSQNLRTFDRLLQLFNTNNDTICQKLQEWFTSVNLMEDST